VNVAKFHRSHSEDAVLRVRMLEARTMLLVRGKRDYRKEECIDLQGELLYAAQNRIIDKLSGNKLPEDVSAESTVELQYQLSPDDNPDWTLSVYLPAISNVVFLNDMLKQGELNLQLQSSSSLKVVEVQERLVIQGSNNALSFPEEQQLREIRDFCDMNNFSYPKSSIVRMQAIPGHQGYEQHAMYYPVRKYLGNCSMC
jgi:hypothetical protein